MALAPEEPTLQWAYLSHAVAVARGGPPCRNPQVARRAAALFKDLMQGYRICPDRTQWQRECTLVARVLASGVIPPFRDLGKTDSLAPAPFNEMAPLYHTGLMLLGKHSRYLRLDTLTWIVNTPAQWPERPEMVVALIERVVMEALRAPDANDGCASRALRAVAELGDKLKDLGSTLKPPMEDLSGRMKVWGESMKEAIDDMSERVKKWKKAQKKKEKTKAIKKK